MYRTKDFTYLPDYTKDFKNAEELFLFLAQKFDIDAESVDSRQYLRMSILMLANTAEYGKINGNFHGVRNTGAVGGKEAKKCEYC